MTLLLNLELVSKARIMSGSWFATYRQRLS